MTGSRRSLAAATAALGVALFGAGCGGAGAHSTPSATSAVTTALAPWAAVHAFALAYVGFLAGSSSASDLPDATAAARQTAASSGRPRAVPGTGTPVLQSASTHEDASWTVVIKDGHHRLFAQLLLAHPPSGWVVDTLVPPDYSTQLQPTGPPRHRPRQPAGSAAPLRAARGFLTGYLRFEYGHAKLDQIRDLTRRLHRYLKRNTPTTVAPLHGRILVLAIRRYGRAWIASPSITDGTNTYEVTVKLTRGGRGQWLADTVTQQ
jgi:hypothetical protein